MYNLLIKLIIIAALAELGMSLRDIDCHSRACVQQLEKRSRDVLRIQWKPISMFPEEAKKFVK
jgi:hypothetical protein